MRRLSLKEFEEPLPRPVGLLSIINAYRLERPYKHAIIVILIQSSSADPEGFPIRPAIVCHHGEACAVGGIQ